MSLRKTLIVIFIAILNYSLGQLIKIDRYEQLDLNASVLIIDNCTKEIDKTTCKNNCQYKILDNLESFKKDEKFLLPDLKIVKYKKKLEDRSGSSERQNEVQLNKNYIEQKIFLLTDENITYRFIVPNRLDNTVYIFNNISFSDATCKPWIINLNLTNLKNSKLDTKYLNYIEDVFQNNLNQSEQYFNDQQLGRKGKDLSNSQIHATFYPGQEAYDLVRFPETTKDNVSSRLTNEKQITKSRSSQSNPAPITIEASVRSDLLLKSATNPRIIFDVTNNMDINVYVTFSCRDEKTILLNLSPSGTYIMPGQTIPVTVLTVIPQNVATGFTDTVTLFAQVQGFYKAEKSALLQMSTQRTQDTWKPNVKYQYTTGCVDVSTGNCESTTWTLEVKAQDKDSGLLQLNTVPFGINIPKAYTSGTKEWVTGYYSASCCNPYIEIFAIDLNNNKQTYKLDANDLHLSDASIAAVVLGVILLIILIVVIVLCVRTKYYSDSRDLPSYRAGSR